jgi:acyl phosphate:glycerol-3-phosphate acyltransferase
VSVSVLLLLTYFLGAIPTSLLISKWKKIDLRSQGSGNLGATNVFRVMGWKYALPVFLFDGFKGALPVFFAIQFYTDPRLHVLVGFIAVMGHSLSIFIKFKGGKGAATGLGVLLALEPIAFLIIIVLAFSLIGLFRYVAPVTLLCCVLTPILFYVLHSPSAYIWFVTCICLLIIGRHHSNIKRLIQGKENKI